jgi:cyclic pyranopterin phosphate synthase
MDAFGRKLDYLRISVTDRCNERCLYCMPKGYRGWVKEPDPLADDEIQRVVRLAADLGFRKIRLTGGEPLVRSSVVDLVRRLSTVAGVERIGLSTNGTRLATLAAPLRRAGVSAINVSLDALSPSVYRRVTGGDVGQVLAGLRAAQAAGFERVKLNCVLLRGINENELWPLILFAGEHDLPLRLIELMPLGTCAMLDQARFLSVGEVMDRVRQREELIPLEDRRFGWGPARYYRLRHTGALVGFIGAITTPHFCDSCNKMRLTADGKIRPCLGAHAEVDLRAALRAGATEGSLRGLLLSAMRQRPFQHQMTGSFRPCRPMTAIGG